MSADRTRKETDSMGAIEVPAERYWGAQTERSRHHFSIGRDLFPLEIIHALARIKGAAARVNADLGVLDERRAALIEAAAREIVGGVWMPSFPCMSG